MKIEKAKTTPKPFRFLIRRDEWAGQVINVLCKAHGVTRQAVESRSRREQLVWVRFIAAVIIRENSALTLTQIASLFGNIHHTAIMHAVTRVRERCEAYPEFAVEMKAWREYFAHAKLKGNSACDL